MRLTTVNATAYERNLSHSERSISSSMVEHTMIIAQKSRRRSRAIRRPSVMHFEGRLASGPEEICNFFAAFIQRTYTDDVWLPPNPGPELVPDDPPLGTLQFTSVEVKSVLQDLVVSKGSGPDGIPLYLLFNRSLATNVFPDRWKVSYVTPIFKKGMRNNVEDYLGVAILSAIPKRFELLVYRGMYKDLKNLMSINQHGEPIDDNEPIGVCIFRAEFN
jgi:hypothetical protein